MGKINVLDKHVAELIAAGEVVERPASVIKELVENAIDAGASNITVEIQNGGTTFMRVTDNGSGLEKEDIPRAFLRHATSKVAGEDDLSAIMTLGFRGEALASIAAVARVELLTRTEEAAGGSLYKMEGGRETVFEEAGCPKGTTIIVRDIFYNVPARMKFLKKDITESGAISALLDRIALSHPEISVRLIRDGKETLRTPGDGKLKSAIFSVYGKDFTSNLIVTNYSLDGVTVSGYIGKPITARPNRNMQVFFINGRYVRTMTAMAAVEQAYKGAIMTGKFPACVLHIQMAPEVVDVNVHPAKTEVRFSNDKPVFDAVYHGVKSALMAGDTPREMAVPSKPPGIVGTPLAAAQDRLNDLVTEKMKGLTKEEIGVSIVPGISIDRTEPRKPAPYAPPVHYVPGKPVSIDIDVEDSEPARTQPSHKPFENKGIDPLFPTRNELSDVVPGKESTNEQISMESNKEQPVRFIGEAFTTYALFESGDRIILIDKHAAHERILYERLKKQQGETSAQLLLSPVSITPSKEEFAALIEHKTLLFQAGFELEEFGPGTILIRSIPSLLDQTDAETQVIEIAGHLLGGKSVMTEQLDWIYHNIACRAAIKAGTVTAAEELAALARQTVDNREVRYCPHGRPVKIVITRKELEKQFGRV